MAGIGARQGVPEGEGRAVELKHGSIGFSSGALRHAGVLLVVGVIILGLTVNGNASARRIPDSISDNELIQLVKSAQRPYLLINETELDALRKVLRRDGPKKDIYLQPVGTNIWDEFAGVGAKTIADRWLKVDIRIPAYGGHAHNFFCDCGAQLAYPPNMETRPSYTCPACGKTYSGEKYDGALRLMRHHQIANAAMDLAVVYGIEKDPRYAEKVADILRKYADVYPGPHTDHSHGGIMMQSLNEAMWVIPLAQAYDLIYDSGRLSQSDKRHIEERLFRPVAKGLIACGNPGNWGSWHFSAVGVIGFAIKDPEMVEYALKSLRSQLSNDLGDDGLWPESIHTYHFFALSAFIYFAEACWRAGIDVYNWEPRPGKGLKLMFSAPLEYMYPTFKLPAINDGWYDSYLPLYLYEIAYKRWKDPAFAWAFETGAPLEKKGLEALLSKSLDYVKAGMHYHFLFGDEQPSNPPAPRFTSTNFSHFGLCTLRIGDTMATFHYGRFWGHGHPDKLSFTLFANGSPMIDDYGTSGYGSPSVRWYQSTASHNTVVVDGKSQAHSKENDITSFYSGSHTQFAEASASDIYPGVTQTRRMMMVGDILLIEDTLTSDTEHNYDWLVHCEGSPEVQGTHIQSDFDTACYSFADFKRKEHIGSSYRLDWSNSNGKLAFCIWPDAGADVALGTCPGESENQRVSFLVCRRHGRTARFLSVFVPAKVGEEIKIDRAGDNVSITRGDAVQSINIKDIRPNGSIGDSISKLESK